MKSNLFVLAFATVLFLLRGVYAEDKFRSVQTNEGYKERIAQQIELLAHAPSEQQSELQRDLAIFYYKDQDHEKAFKLYLDALEMVRPMSAPMISQEEELLYNNALQTYLDNQTKAASVIAENIRQQYASVLVARPDYYRLGYIIAAADANLEMFEEFFQQFYQSYCMLPQHYLAYKTKAILHAKLFARARTPIDREMQRQAVLDNLTQAIQQYPADVGLYKALFATVSDDKRPAIVNVYLNKIIDENIIIPRSDIAFYVRQALDAKQVELARRFVNRGRQWHQNSRVIDAAQKHIDQYKEN